MRNQRSSIIIFIIIGIFISLAGTAWVHYLFASPDRSSDILKNATLVYSISQFNLASENTLVTWFSSMLLFTAGIFALLSYWSRREVAGDQRFLKGWLIIAAMFALLSLDELGSIHENLGHLSTLDIMGNNSWESVLAIPVFLVVAYLVVFGWIHLRHKPATYSFMILGTLLFATIPVQEHFEMLRWKEFDYAEDYNRPIPLVLLEEGSELFGTLCFIISMLLYIRSNTKGSASPDTRVLDGHERRTFFVGALVIAGLLVLLYNISAHQMLSADEGIAANWIPAIMPILVYLAHRYYSDQSSNFILVYSLVLSAYFGINFYMILNWGEVRWLVRLTQLIMLSGLAYYIYDLSYALRNSAWRLQHIIGGMLIAPAFVFEHGIVTVGMVAGCLTIVHAQLFVKTR